MRALTPASILGPMEPQFISLANAHSFELAPGAIAKPLFGEGAMLNLVELEPDAVVALHSHPHEQLGIVLRGSMKLVVAGVDHELAEMDAFTLPGGIEHQGIAGPDGAVVLDVFQPVREDYRRSAGA